MRNFVNVSQLRTHSFVSLNSFRRTTQTWYVMFRFWEASKGHKDRFSSRKCVSLRTRKGSHIVFVPKFWSHRSSSQILMVSLIGSFCSARRSSVHGACFPAVLEAKEAVLCRKNRWKLGIIYCWRRDLSSVYSQRLDLSSCISSSKLSVTWTDWPRLFRTHTWFCSCSILEI